MTPSQRHDALLKHLDTLYAFAQVITPDAEHAGQLVEATYQRAFRLPAEAQTLPDGKAWLIQLMLRLLEASSAASARRSPQEPPLDLKGLQTPALDDFRKRLTEQLIDRVLPATFAMLERQQQLLLMLCEVEGMACADAGLVLGIPAEIACERLTVARATLVHTLRSSASPAERRLLSEDLPPLWLRRGLARTLQLALVPAPPTLQPTLQAAAPPGRVAAPGSAGRHPAVAMSTERPAAARAKRPGKTTSPVARRLRQILMGITLIVSAALLGYLVTTLVPEQQPEVDLVVLSSRQAATPTNISPGSPEQAERYVQDRLGWRLTVPDIEGATLSGYGISEIAEGVEVPVFVFQETESQENITLYAYTYALLDRYADRIRLARDVLSQIENEAHYDLHDLGSTQVLIWRNQDDIFVAVTPGSADTLRGRITFPS